MSQDVFQMKMDKLLEECPESLAFMMTLLCIV